MSDEQAGTGPGTYAGGIGGVLAVFTLTTFLSAMLLFSVQPMFTKMVLPLLGGAPSVWAVALVFFQTALLAGYCYAHALIRYVPVKTTGLIHLGLTAAAIVALPIAVPAGWTEPPPGEPYLWQLGLFALAVGLPFVAVAANAPLLQAWFTRTGHAQAKDPYFLYAASNLGSFIALLGYPLVLEPVFGLSSLAKVWAAGFVALIAALALCVFMVRAGWTDSDTCATAGTLDDAAPQWVDRLRWVGLSLVPSALLTAFTTHVATDVASAPLIWVIPLALYLLTFVIVFRERSLIPMPVLLAVHLVSVLACLVQLSRLESDSLYISGFLGIAAFVTSALVAHRTLYEARPGASHLTEFYLWMSLGGALGGTFAALVAPQIFSQVFEYPLLLALSFACRPGALDWSALRQRSWILPVLGACAALVVLVPLVSDKMGWTFGVWGPTAVAVIALAAAAVAFWKYPTPQLVVGALMGLAIITQPSSVRRGEAERSYFGVHRVIQSEDGVFNLLQHGTTLHGAQRVRDEEGKPVNDTEPVTYYHPKSPMAQSVLWARVAVPKDAKGRFGVVGLGSGSLACHSAEGETWRFYEIDPVVTGIAKSDKFTYLKSCLPNADIVMGDARLTLAKEPDESFDYLLVDAFSSDAVPTHLMTVEALTMYAAKLKPDGLGVLHISNRYLDLEAVLQATIPAVPGIAAVTVEDRSASRGYAVMRSTAIIFSKNPQNAMRLLGPRGGRTLTYRALSPWTDDSSDVLGPLISRYRNPG